MIAPNSKHFFSKAAFARLQNRIGGGSGDGTFLTPNPIFAPLVS
jgi:hypothetical protein